MKKLFSVLVLSLLLFSTNCFADDPVRGGLSLKDASTTTYPYEITVTPDGSVTDDGDGTATLAVGGSVEGTAVLSTGEGGGTKYLREDGDGTCSWQTPAGSGDVESVGDCTGGACLDGTDDGGTYVTFYNIDSNKTQLIASDTASDLVVTLPAATGTLLTAETNDLESVATNAADAEVFVGTGANAGAYITGLAACAADEKIEYVPGSPDTFTCEAIGGLVDGDISDTLTSSTCTGNAATVTNATLTTALTVDTGTVGLVGNVANTSVLTLGAGASSIAGTNTGDNDEVGTLTTGDMCTNDGSVVQCTVNTEAELETAMDALDIVTVTADDITSANLATLVNGETGTGNPVFDTSPTITGLTHASNIKSMPQPLRFTIIDPNAAYDVDTQFLVWRQTDAAITITNIECACDADPTNELDWDLKHADSFIGFGSAAVIDEINTSAGTTAIATGFDDATVPINKDIYVEFSADPDDAMTQVGCTITWDYD